MKPCPPQKILQWVLQAWESLSKEVIIDSMKSCALGLAVDGSKDDKFYASTKARKLQMGEKGYKIK